MPRISCHSHFTSEEVKRKSPLIQRGSPWDNPHISKQGTQLNAGQKNQGRVSRPGTKPRKFHNCCKLSAKGFSDTGKDSHISVARRRPGYPTGSHEDLSTAKQCLREETRTVIPDECYTQWPFIAEYLLLIHTLSYLPHFYNKHEKWKWESEHVSHSLVSDSGQPYGLQPARLLSTGFSRQGCWRR